MTERDGSSGGTSGTPSPPVAPPEVAGPPSSGVLAARLAEIEARFAGQLEDSQRAQIRRAIERQMALAARLRRTPLANADEPEIVFRPYRDSADPSRGDSGG